MRRQSPLDERSRILLAHLRSHDSSRVAYVRTALAEMSQDEAVGILVSWMSDLKREQIVGMASLSGAMCVLAILVAAFSALVSDDHHIQVGALGCLLAPVLSYVSNLRRLRQQVFTFLAGFDDKRILNVLVEAVRYGDTKSSRAAETSLIQLLPTVRPGDEHILSPQCRMTLNHWLLEATYAPLVLAILSAWEQVGDQAAARLVERLSHGEGVLGGDFSIRHAAAEALPAVRDAANRTATAETLLRATSADESATALLRPASSAESSDQALLRPAAD